MEFHELQETTYEAYDADMTLFFAHPTKIHSQNYAFICSFILLWESTDTAYYMKHTTHKRRRFATSGNTLHK